MTQFDLMLERLHRGKNPYAGFPVDSWSGTWFGDPGAMRQIFKDSLDMVKPKIVLEVGSFVAESTIFMADHIKSRAWDCVIVMIDTWRGGVDHWLRANEKIQFHFGAVDLYYKCIANVIQRGHQDIILPLTLDSLNAARLLKAMDIRPDYLYLDASHEEGDVGRDMEAYWDLLPSGGGMLIDDISGHFPGVVADWHRFEKAHNLTAALVEGEKVFVIKP